MNVLTAGSFAAGQVTLVDAVVSGVSVMGRAFRVGVWYILYRKSGVAPFQRHLANSPYLFSVIIGH